MKKSSFEILKRLITWIVLFSGWPQGCVRSCSYAVDRYYRSSVFWKEILAAWKVVSLLLLLNISNIDINW